MRSSIVSRVASAVSVIGTLSILLVLHPVLAQDRPANDRDRDRESQRARDGEAQRAREGEARRPRDGEAQRGREGGIPRGRVQASDSDRARGEGMEEGQPRLRAEGDENRVTPQLVPPRGRHWRLGVYAHNTDTGVVVTRVVPRSAAWQAGLEPGDRIVTVNGYQVGWVQDHLYPLGNELQRRASRDGYVTLLLQNVRNRRILNREVQLDSRR